MTEQTFKWVRIEPLTSGYLVECEMNQVFSEGENFVLFIHQRHAFALYEEVEKFLLEHISK